MLVVLNDWVSINPNEVAWMHVVDMDHDDKSATRWLDIQMRDGRHFQSELGDDPYFLKKTIERMLKRHHGSGTPLQLASGKPYDPTKGPLAEAGAKPAKPATGLTYPGNGEGNVKVVEAEATITATDRSKVRKKPAWAR